MAGESSQQMFSLPKWLPTIVMIITLLASWGGAIAKFTSLQNEVASLRTEISTLKAEAKSSDQTLVNLQIDIRDIKTNLEFIKEKVR